MSTTDTTPPTDDDADSGDTDNDKELDALMMMVSRWGAAMRRYNMVESDDGTDCDAAWEALRSKLSALLKVERAAADLVDWMRPQRNDAALAARLTDAIKEYRDGK